MKEKNKKIAIDCLQKGILDALKNSIDKEEHKLLETYLPYTLNELTEYEHEKVVKFLKLLKEYNWETNSTEEEKQYLKEHGCSPNGKYIDFQHNMGATMARSLWDIENGFDGNNTRYTIFLNFLTEDNNCCYSTVDYKYVLELEWQGDLQGKYLELDVPEEEYEYDICGLTIGIFDVTDNKVTAYPMTTTFGKDIL